MKNLLVILMIFLAGSFLSGCHGKKDTEEQRLSWSTESPLSIPYRTRFQRLEKKNLVRNHSFETGRTFKLDSIKTSFVLDGWLQVGPHVEWVDTRKDSLYTGDEALSGHRAVKITRRIAYETDQQGEGVISDFIKVIPGNYSLSFYTKLEDVKPVKRRLGIKMNDAVDIRLLYFDKSKIAIGPEHSFPQVNQYIDNSFKSLSFANFNHIQSFGWGKIIGKSADFPFPDGDIPTNAHYVKIFLGLKGLGTMWIDSVNFSYTRKNFSVEERMLPYTDTTYTVQPFVLPTPKEMQRKESVIFFRKGDPERLPLIVIPEKAAPVILYAAGLLQKALMRSAAKANAGDQKIPEIRIVTAGPGQLLSPDKLTFVLGTNILCEKYRNGFPVADIQDHPQGYYLYSPVDLPHTVFLNGNNTLGIYYAVLTALQLIDAQQPVFHMARVVDYPDFEDRYYTLGKMPDQAAVDRNIRFAGELEALKINGAFYPTGSIHGNDPGTSIARFRQTIAGSGNFNVAGLELGETVDSWSFSKHIYAPGLLMPDDSSLCYSLPPDPDHLEAVSEAEERSAIHSGNRVKGTFLLPKVFNNQLMNYLSCYGKPGPGISDYPYVYSGSSFFSINTDDADFYGFLKFTREKPVFMDNSMIVSSEWGHFDGAYPYFTGKIRLYNIFEPFGNTGMRDHMKQLDTSLYWVNMKPQSEMESIRLCTAADFMWNMQDYDPDFSLWKVLLSRYGAKAARALIHYADVYGMMLEIELKLERNEPIPRNLKNVQNDFSSLVMASGSLEPLLGHNHPLMKEILSLNSLLKTRLDKHTGSSSATP
jgi:hypothetical protein